MDAYLTEVAFSESDEEAEATPPFKAKHRKSSRRQESGDSDDDDGEPSRRRPRKAIRRGYRE
jgi:hypothetical protein